MPTSRQPILTAWDASARVDAAADTDALVTETQGRPIFWAVTANTTAPAFSVHFGHRIEPRASQGVSLKAGEYLWLAAETEFNCTLTTGAA